MPRTHRASWRPGARSGTATPHERPHLNAAVQMAMSGWDEDRLCEAWYAIGRRHPILYPAPCSVPVDRSHAIRNVTHPDADQAARASAGLWNGTPANAPRRAFGREVAAVLLKRLRGDPYVRDWYAVCPECWYEGDGDGPSCGHAPLDAWMETQDGREARLIIAEAVRYGDFSGLGAAADALEMAGCRDAYILDALRSRRGDRHVRCSACDGMGLGPDPVADPLDRSCPACWGTGTAPLPWHQGDRMLDRLGGLA